MKEIFKNKNTIFQRICSEPNMLFYLLVPASLIFMIIVTIRRYLYQKGWFKSYALPVPVIIVGNIRVGGTGKTPITLWLAQYLKTQGLKPGIVTRGYKGQRSKAQDVMVVAKNSDPRVVGDEAFLLAKNSDCPVVVGRSRVAAAQALLKHFPATQLIICDDGLQHYALKRNVEIALINNKRVKENSFCLPAGPLREPVTRLKQVDLILEYEKDFYFIPKVWRRVNDPKITCPLNTFKFKILQVVCGIGQPERFNKSLKKLDYTIRITTYADHHDFTAEDFKKFKQDDVVVMTEKDAVKCYSFASDNMWYLEVETSLSSEAIKKIHAMTR